MRKNYFTLTMALLGLFHFSCQTTPSPGSSASPHLPASTATAVATPVATAAATSEALPSHSHSPSLEEGFNYQPYLFQVDEELISGNHDFGKVPQGKKVKHTFTIQNTTSFAITLGEPRSTISCCVTAKPSQTLIEPGQSAELVVTLDSTHQDSPLTANVVVPNDGQEHPNIFRVFADVQRIIWVEPYLVEISNGQGQLEVKSDRFSKGLKITRTEPDTPDLEVIPGEPTKTGQPFKLSTKKELKEYGFVRLHTNDKEIPDVVVQYHFTKK